MENQRIETVDTCLIVTEKPTIVDKIRIVKGGAIDDEKISYKILMSFKENFGPSMDVNFTKFEAERSNAPSIGLQNIGFVSISESLTYQGWIEIGHNVNLIVGDIYRTKFDMVIDDVTFGYNRRAEVVL